MKEIFPSNDAPRTADDGNGPDLGIVEEQIRILEASVASQDKNRQDVREEVVTMVRGNRRLNKRTTNSPKFNAAFDTAVVAKNVVAHKDKELEIDEQAIISEEARINYLKKRLSALESGQTIISLTSLKGELDKAEVALQAKKNIVGAKRDNYTNDVQSTISQTHTLSDIHKDQQEDVVKNDVDFAIETVSASKGDDAKDFIRTPEFRSNIEGILAQRENSDNSSIPKYIEKQREYLGGLEEELRMYEEKLSSISQELNDIKVKLDERKWDIIGITKQSLFSRARKLFREISKIDIENFRETFIFMDQSSGNSRVHNRIMRSYEEGINAHYSYKNQYIDSVRERIKGDLSGQLDEFEGEFISRTTDIINRGNNVFSLIEKIREFFRSM